MTDTKAEKGARAGYSPDIASATVRRRNYPEYMENLILSGFYHDIALLEAAPRFKPGKVCKLQESMQEMLVAICGPGMSRLNGPAGYYNQ